MSWSALERSRARAFVNEVCPLGSPNGARFVPPAYYIASKFEDLYSVDVSDLFRVCGRAYTRHQILDMEIEVLTCIHFRVCVCGVLDVLSACVCVCVEA